MEQARFNSLATLLALTVLWDWSGLDVTVMQQIGGPDGFALRNHWLLEHWLVAPEAVMPAGC